MDNEMIWKKRADIFFNSSNAVHIITKKESWINGYITETPGDISFYVLDRKLGKIPVFYSDVASMDFFLGDLGSLPKVK